jgi:hypothetical protein
MWKAIKVLLFVSALLAYSWGVVATCDWLTKPPWHPKKMQSTDYPDRPEKDPIPHGS